MVRITSYNIHAGVGNDGKYDLQRIGATLRRSCCDIACLQEVEVNFAERQLRSASARHADNQAEQLAYHLGFDYYSFAGPLNAYCAEVKDGGKDTSCLSPPEEILVRDKTGQAGYGNAILSRYPILDSKYLLYEQDKAPLSEEYVYMDREEQPRCARAILVDTRHGFEASESAPAPRAKDKREKRPALFGDCCQRQVPAKCPDAPIWIVTTHLSHKTGSEEQRSQAGQLVKFVESLLKESVGHSKPGIVLCGDLNAAPLQCWTSYSILSSDPRFTDAWKEAGGSFWHQSTFPSQGCTSPCGLHLDHVFLVEHQQAAKLQCRGIRVMKSQEDSMGSNHRPVLAEVVVVPK